MSSADQGWNHRGFWGAAVVTAPAYTWIIWHLAGTVSLDRFIGWSLLVVALAIGLGTLSSDLRETLYGIAFSMVVTFGAVAVFAMVAVNQCDCIG